MPEQSADMHRPKRPDAAVIVGAYNDAYVSQKSVRELAQHWPGSQVRPLCRVEGSGHASQARWLAIRQPRLLTLREG